MFEKKKKLREQKVFHFLLKDKDGMSSTNKTFDAWKKKKVKMFKGAKSFFFFAQGQRWHVLICKLFFSAAIVWKKWCGKRMDEKKHEKKQSTFFATLHPPFFWSLQKVTFEKIFPSSVF